MTIFTFTANYNEELAQHIDDLFTQDKRFKLPREERLQASDSLIESYVKHTGLRPPGAQLGRLATLILRDELADTDRMKVRNNDYPIMSDDQIRRREDGEVSFKLSEEVATDGRDYRIKTRDSNRKFREMTRGL